MLSIFAENEVSKHSMKMKNYSGLLNGDCDFGKYKFGDRFQAKFGKKLFRTECNFEKKSAGKNVICVNIDVSISFCYFAFD